MDASDAALAAAVGGGAPLGPDAERSLTAAEFTAATGVSPAILAAIDRAGFLTPLVVDGEPRYTDADVEAVRAGVELLEAGLPLGELLDLARRFDEGMTPVADHAVDLFVRFVRDPVHGTAADEQEAAHRLLDAFQSMLAATGVVVAHQVRRLLLARARARIETELDPDGGTAGAG